MLLNYQFLLFTGKGGVGKSTIAVATALKAVEQGMRPLIVEMNDRASLHAILRSKEETCYEPREIGHGVWGMNLEFEPSLLEYLQAHVPVSRLVDAMGKNRALQRFFKAAPAVAEVASLHKLASLVEESERGRSRWDLVIVDLEATGHALMLLDLPNVMEGLIGKSPLKKLFERVSKLLSNRQRTRLNFVTLPQELPVQETSEIYHRISERDDIPLGWVFVNQIPIDPLSERCRPWMKPLQERAEAHNQKFVASALQLAERNSLRAEEARRQIERLREKVDLPFVELFQMAAIDGGPSELLRLANGVFEQMQGGGS